MRGGSQKYWQFPDVSHIWQLVGEHSWHMKTKICAFRNVGYGSKKGFHLVAISPLLSYSLSSHKSTCRPEIEPSLFTHGHRDVSRETQKPFSPNHFLLMTQNCLGSGQQELSGRHSNLILLAIIASIVSKWPTKDKSRAWQKRCTIAVTPLQIWSQL